MSTSVQGFRPTFYLKRLYCAVITPIVDLAEVFRNRVVAIMTLEFYYSNIERLCPLICAKMSELLDSDW